MSEEAQPHSLKQRDASGVFGDSLHYLHEHTVVENHGDEHGDCDEGS